MKISKNPFVISGPSGAGKSTFILKLIQDYPKNFELLVSHTTRKPRVNEIHEKHYYFISKEEFENLIAKDSFIEHFPVHKNFYGTSYQELQRISDNGRVPVLDIDIQGAMMIKSKENIVKSNFLFIMPPSIQILEQRLRNRKTDDENTIQIRLKNAINEIETAKKSGIYQQQDYIINDNFDKAYETFFKRVKSLYTF